MQLPPQAPWKSERPFRRHRGRVVFTLLGTCTCTASGFPLRLSSARARLSFYHCQMIEPQLLLNVQAVTLEADSVAPVLTQ